MDDRIRYNFDPQTSYVGRLRYRRKQNVKWLLIGAGIVALLWAGTALGHASSNACRYRDIQFQCQ